MKKLSENERALFQALRDHPITVHTGRAPDVMEKLDILRDLSNALHAVTEAQYKQGGENVT